MEVRIGGREIISDNPKRAPVPAMEIIYGDRTLGSSKISKDKVEYLFCIGGEILV